MHKKAIIFSFEVILFYVLLINFLIVCNSFGNSLPLNLTLSTNHINKTINVFKTNDLNFFSEQSNTIFCGSAKSIQFGKKVSFLHFYNCHKIVIRRWNVSYYPSPSFFGTILNDQTSDDTVELSLNTEVSCLVQAVTGFNTVLERFARPDKYFHQRKVEILPTSNPRLYSLQGTPPLALKKDQVLAFRTTTYGSPVMQFVNCSNLILEDMVIEKAPGMGLHFKNCTNIILRRIRFPTPADAPFSANADATHFRDCRGLIQFENCSFERMGDDAINVHGTYGRLDEVLNTNTIQYLTGRRDVDWPAPAANAGDVVSIHHPTNPFGKPLVQGVVLSSQSGSEDKSLQITLDAPVSEDLPKDSVVWNQSTSPSLVVTKCKFLNNRARGILIQSSNARIEDNWFQGMTGPAIKVTCDVGRWWESGPSTNIVIRNNFISDCNDGPGSAQGAITVNADAPGLKPIAGVHRNIEISGNRIRDVGGMGIFVSSAADVRIFQNRLSTTSPPFILTKDSLDVVLKENTTDKLGTPILPKDGTP